MEIFIIFQLLLLFWANPTESQQCTDLDWSSTFAIAGDSMSQCSNNVSYVNALTGQGYGVNLQTGPNVIETARCCGVNLPYSQEANDCYWEQWWVAMARHNNWATCEQEGYFIHGFFTAGPNFLSDIGMAQCCKPQSHPGRDGPCEEVRNVDFTQDGTKQCKEGFFLKGFYRTTCSTINCLTGFRCCRMIPGTVNGGWSDWGQWSSCSTTCGGGIQRRTRACDNPAPSGQGLTCQGSPVGVQRCNSDPCPVNGGWSDWSQWGACSVTCGSGSQQRSRTCTNPPPSAGGAQCSGGATENQGCNKKSCVVDGGWSQWSGWTKCSFNCGAKGGEQTATRTCTNPPPANGGNDCSGKAQKKRVCNKTPCVFSEWSKWGPCSKTCGGGQKIRTRKCLTDPPCQGSVKEFRFCKRKDCP